MRQQASPRLTSPLQELDPPSSIIGRPPSASACLSCASDIGCRAVRKTSILAVPQDTSSDA
jgi:hypothetical protein